MWRRNCSSLCQLRSSGCSKSGQLLLTPLACSAQRAINQIANKHGLWHRQHWFCSLPKLQLQVLLPLAQLLPRSACIQQHALQDLLLKQKCPFPLLQLDERCVVGTVRVPNMP